MKLKEALDKIKKDSKFKEWEKNNKKAYFSYAFCTIGGDKNNGWQLGYYNKEKDRMTTFTINNEVAISPEEEVFKKQDMKVKKIGLAKVKLDLDIILEKIKRFQKDKYSNEMPVKKIIILQNLEKLGNIWNITYVTKSFKTLNMKVNAENGEILQHKLSSIFSFKAS